MIADEDANGGREAAACETCGALHGDNGHDHAQDDESDRLRLMRAVAALHAKYERPLTTQQITNAPDARRVIEADMTRILVVEEGEE